MAGWSLDMPIIDHTPVRRLNKIALELLLKNFLCLQQQFGFQQQLVPADIFRRQALENMQTRSAASE